MSGPYEPPRVYINWSRVRPNSLRGWTMLIGFVALAFVVLAVAAFIASTIFAFALVAALIASVAYLFGTLFTWRRPRRDVAPYRGDDA